MSEATAIVSSQFAQPFSTINYCRLEYLLNFRVAAFRSAILTIQRFSTSFSRRVKHMKKYLQRDLTLTRTCCENCFRILTSRRWKGTALGHISAEHGAFLKDIDLFDNVEFGVSQKDAMTMSPSTRKLLEHSFLALRDSGIDFRGRQVGCFATGVDHDLAYFSDAVGPSGLSTVFS